MRTDYKEIYEAREKARRDEIGRITAVERRGIAIGLQRGLEKGIEEGIEQGIKEGIEKGIEKGIKEGIEKGIKEGKLAGKVQTYQEMLGDEVSSDNQLLSLMPAELNSMIKELQGRLRQRKV